MKGLLLTIAACAALVLAACGDDDSPSDSSPSRGSAPVESSGDASDRSKPKVAIPAGAPPRTLEETDLIEGTGPEAQPGDEVTVNYVGVNFKNGKEFDASWNRGEPFSFTLAASEVIPGWDQGVEGMKVGGRRQLVIPPDLAYGEIGSPPLIGANETLVFVIDLLEVN